MKTRLFTGLVIASALACAVPTFASERRDASRGASVAASHRSAGPERAVATARRSEAARSFVASRAPRRVSTPSFASARRPVTVNRSTVSRVRVNTSAGRAYAASRNFNGQGRSSVAFAGNTRNYERGDSGHGGFAFRSHSGWDREREYAWEGHHYRWYNDGWYVVDLNPDYAGYYGGYGYNADVPVRVQTALENAGYYNGPVDGIVGHGTRAAIAAYQQDNGLPVTGTITPGLLDSLGIS